MQKDWAKRPPRSAAASCKAWYDLIVANADDLALILTTEQGKPLSEAKAEVLSNAAYIEWFAEEAKRIDGDVIPGAAPNQRILVLKQPVGVCAAITPWNFPNGMITRKVGPALAAGCTMVLKPAAQTPLSALALAVLAERAGVPKGAFSVITTDDAKAIGAEFCHNPKVAKITFTGSTGVGRWLMKEAADGIKRLSLELGGNAPFIVFDDADLDAAVDGAMASKFRNAGQTCVCANRIYVQESVAAAFAEKLAAKAKALKLGRGTEAGVSHGPADRRPRRGQDGGACGRCPGKGRAGAGGRPALEPRRHVLRADRDDRDHAGHEGDEGGDVCAAGADRGVYGRGRGDRDGERLGVRAGGVLLCPDMARVWRVAEALESGMVGVNTPALANEMAPFGGVKQSGLGREGSKYGIEGFLEIKYINLAM